MMKVVIVDDEPKLRQGLQTLIPWESLGFTVAATAGNGKEALKVIGEEVPEVIVADIRMPVMDGLQLIRHLRSNGQQSHFIILSGYADFEYAQQAIRYGVDGYLLKPVNISEMSETLKLVRERIEEERLQEEGYRAEAVNQDLVLHDLLAPREMPEDPAQLRSKLGHANLLWSSYEVVVICPRVSEADRQEALNQLSAGLKQGIEGRRMGLVSVIHPYVILLLNAPLRGRQSRDNLYGEIRSAAGDTRFVAATSGAVTEPEQICGSYAKAQEAVKQAFFSEKDLLLEPGLPLLPSPELPRLPDDSYEEKMNALIFRLYYSLDAGNKTMVFPLLNEAAALFLSQEQDEKSVKQSFFFLSNAIIHKLTAASPIELKETETVSRFLNGIYQHDYLQDLLEEICRFLLAFAEDTEPKGKEQEIKKMIDFIQRHYAEDFKLSTLAGLLNYSTPYLGQLFRNMTGEYFNTYVDKVRIQKAKELLAQGMKVYEVAELVGYTSVNYFFSKFKKYENRSPSDYKKP
ncbi:response regulator transcription factor [Paenibacillus sp. HN-1]|uniref:response regulator transcription factor n=1 Tax=Paenibacillus TaxID=44249 RepID=UPI001CA9FB8E|nr:MULTISPECIES: response regulator transcription factor [Paenibacillus]MBY9080697.1 response regulator transcription factor [Paenibacillus sp. CGMCC 1.18879]MBY9085358.1 response regulator transcription factor [Paenibacillus sinensis]